jgi:co-chaperonin GroES (HSP10)
MVSANTPKIIQPIGNWLICEPLYEKQTKGGLALPEHIAKGDSLSNLKRARVLRAGRGKAHPQTGVFMPNEFKVGQVVYPFANVMVFRENGRELWALTEECICGVEEPEEGPKLSLVPDTLDALEGHMEE